MVNLSIIIPIYNEEKLLPGCLESLFRQLRDGDEILCVIDIRTTDSSCYICTQYPARILSSASGKLTQRDRGIRRADNDVIVAVDADCVYPEGYLDDIREIMLDKSYVAANGWHHWPAPQFIRKWYHDRRMSGAFSAFRREAYLALGGFNLDINQHSHKQMVDEEEYGLLRRMKTLGKIGWIKTGAYHRRIAIPYLWKFMGSKIDVI